MKELLNNCNSYTIYVKKHSLSGIRADLSNIEITTSTLLILDVDPPLNRRQICGGSKSAVERMLEFGRTLYHMSQRLMLEQGKDENNKKMLQVIPYTL